MPIPVDVQLPYVEQAEIVIDGHLNEPAWDDAVHFEDFHAYYPEPDAPVQGAARVRVLTDASGIYFFWQVTIEESAEVWAHVTRRDRIFGDDTVGVYLDPAGDGQRGYLFLSNPYGVQADAVRVVNQNDSFAWDGRWSSAGTLTDTGYQVEVSIPWNSVRHPASPDQIGLSLLRGSPRTHQRSGWPRRDPDIQGILVQEALLGWSGEMPANRALQLLPEVTAGYTDQGALEGRWGFAGISPGLTFRYDPSPSFATLGTVNPDFSQVESDASQIDINNRYALYLQEKRPFFVEGSEWFSTEFDDLLYTRSMVQPRAGVRSTAEQGGWTVAALSVLDSAPSESVSEGGGWTAAELEGHLAMASILRARASVGTDSAVGAFFSDRTILDSKMYNRLAGADGSLRLSDTWILGAAAIGSHTRLHDDETLTGPAGTIDLSHQSRSWELGLGSTYVSPDFRAENGYVTYADRMSLNAAATRQIYPSAEGIARIGLDLFSADLGLDTDWNRRDHSLAPGIVMELDNGVKLSSHTSHWSELYAEKVLQGIDFFHTLNGSLNETLRYGLGFSSGDAVYYDEDAPVVGALQSFGGILTLRPGRRLTIRQRTTWQQFIMPDDSLAYEGYIYRLSSELYLNKNTWLRLIVDRSSFSDENSLETLVAWEKAPGQSAYLGGAIRSAGDWTALAAPTEWQVFTKVAWAFGL
ncbi:MAG: sugar-binding protein [Myxococcota bacterium]|nr:sugar-binding protein [Myxococcota bacterium]